MPTETKIVYAEKCFECPDYVPVEENRFGICDRLGDCGGEVPRVFGQQACIYGRPGEKLVAENIERRNIEEETKQSKFVAGLEYASKTVGNWPEWKRRACALPPLDSDIWAD